MQMRTLLCAGLCALAVGCAAAAEPTNIEEAVDYVRCPDAKIERVEPNPFVPGLTHQAQCSDGTRISWFENTEGRDAAIELLDVLSDGTYEPIQVGEHFILTDQ